MSALSAEAAFERDVPAELRYDVMTILSECAQGGTHEDVTILERDRRDAINVRAHGIVRIGENEFVFQMRDGNWDGTVIEEWESDKPFEVSPQTEWALQPKNETVMDALAAGRGAFLILKWDAVAQREPFASLAGKYGYDRYFQPGGKTETYYREAAAAGGFVLVSKEQADETRARLAKPVTP